MSKFVSGYSKVMDRIVKIIKIIIAIALVLDGCHYICRSYQKICIW